VLVVEVLMLATCVVAADVLVEMVAGFSLQPTAAALIVNSATRLHLKRIGCIAYTSTKESSLLPNTLHNGTG
jgi:hypothetical protein